MKSIKRTLVAAAAAVLASGTALADVNIGVSLSLTGPGSGLGIPMQNQLKLFPPTIAGEKVNLIILDDATDHWGYTKETGVMLKVDRKSVV